MNKEVLKEKDLEFVLREKPKLKCFDCKKEFSHLEKCKDGKDRCKNCKKKLVTNPFYNKNYEKRRGFIGKFNMSEDEKKHLMTNLIKKGVPYKEAKRRIENDVKVLSEMKKKKNYNNRLEEQNKKIQSKTSKEMKNKLLKGLGLKKDDN